MTTGQKEAKIIVVEILNTGGLNPQPVLKIAVKAADMNHGDILEGVGDCPTFEGMFENGANDSKKFFFL